MISIAFPADGLDQLRCALSEQTAETAAIILCVPVPLGLGDDWRLIVKEVHVAGTGDYQKRTPVAVTLRPEFGLPVERKAGENGWSLVYCHTHVGVAPLCGFSPTDDAAETALAAYASGRSPRVPHCALLIAGDTILARRLGSNEAVRVLRAGESAAEEIRIAPAIHAEDQFDRQIRAFGAEGQERLQRIRLALVGLGGTGSAAAQQFAHLGVRKFILIDRDTVENSNLNRTFGATSADVGRPKVEVAARMVRAIRGDAEIEVLARDVADDDVARALLKADLVLSCTDSHASRHVINQIAYQYALPGIDMGVAIEAAAGRAAHIAGHVKALAPGLACLWCLGSLDPRQVREDLMNPEQRQQDPYFRGAKAPPQPAVISINSTVVSAAVTMLLAMVAGLDAPARYIVYDGNRQRMSAVDVAADPGCSFCGADSTALCGDEAPLPTRRNGAR